MLRAVIIDDEAAYRRALQIHLQEHCPDVHLITEAKDVSHGLNVIYKHKPDIVFLDVEMGDGTGFDLLKELQNSQTDINFEVIFTTSHEEFALKAYRYSAIDYLVKPIRAEHLIEAVAKVRKQLQGTAPLQIEQKIDALFQNKTKIKKIGFPTLTGSKFVYIDDIILCEADGSYTKVKLKGDSKMMIVSKKLKEFEELLTTDNQNFVRVHRSYIVNLNYIIKYEKTGYLYLEENIWIEIPRRRREAFKNLIQSLSLFKKPNNLGDSNTESFNNPSME